MRQSFAYDCRLVIVLPEDRWRHDGCAACIGGKGIICRKPVKYLAYWVQRSGKNKVHRQNKRPLCKSCGIKYATNKKIPLPDGTR